MNRIVIFANGILTRPDLLRAHLQPTDRIFCANGGTRHALALGLTPEAIIGDLDSLPDDVVADMEQAGVRFHRYPANKDQNDLELACQLAVAEKPAEIILVAALGGRLDQMLANIFLLSRPEYASIPFRLVDGLQQLRLLQAGSTLTLSGQPGDTLSLIPLTATVKQVTLTGVKWPLAQVTLLFGSTLSISNEFVATQATVQIGTGQLLLLYIDKNHEENQSK